MEALRAIWTTSEICLYPEAFFDSKAAHKLSFHRLHALKTRMQLVIYLAH